MSLMCLSLKDRLGDNLEALSGAVTCIVPGACQISAFFVFLLPV